VAIVLWTLYYPMLKPELELNLTLRRPVRSFSLDFSFTQLCTFTYLYNIYWISFTFKYMLKFLSSRLTHVIIFSYSSFNPQRLTQSMLDRSNSDNSNSRILKLRFYWLLYFYHGCGAICTSLNHPRWEFIRTSVVSSL